MKNRTTQVSEDFLVGSDDLILVTGAAGFIGSRVVASLLDRGFRNIRCFVRPFAKTANLEALQGGGLAGTRVERFEGNLLSRQDCIRATEGAQVIFHLAAGRGEKSFPEAYMNSVITTRNLIGGAARHGCVRRFVNVSSFTVYTNMGKPYGRLLDESCPIETDPHGRGGAYTFAKVKQEEMVRECSARLGMPVVMVRPGYVYGPGNLGITGRVGVGSFGIFLHLGGSNQIPFTYVDNCAEAIALAGLKAGVDGEVFNVVDDDLPLEPAVLEAVQKESPAIPVALFATRGKLCSLLSVESLLGLVGRATSAEL